MCMQELDRGSSFLFQSMTYDPDEMMRRAEIRTVNRRQCVFPHASLRAGLLVGDMKWGRKSFALM